jgi:hypothetical protein
LYPEGVANTPPLAAIWMLAPLFDAAPTSDTHKAAEELFCTRNPFAGAAPPNRVWALPPVATVPLPSLAVAPAVLMTGSGFYGPTGLETPCALVEAGACTGTRLPLPSTSVASGWIVVLASLTSNVMGSPGKFTTKQ